MKLVHLFNFSLFLGKKKPKELPEIGFGRGIKLNEQKAFKVKRAANESRYMQLIRKLEPEEEQAFRKRKAANELHNKTKTEI